MKLKLKEKKKLSPILSDENYRDNDRYIEGGLSQWEIDERIADGRVNGDSMVKTKSVAQIFCGKIFTFFNFIFVFMAIILAFFSKNITDFGFLVLVVINAVIGIVQELRAKKTMDKLSLISAPKVRVLRAKVESEIAVKDVLLNDLTVLSAGNQICADAVVVEGKIEVNESLITGEVDAITKRVGDKVMSGSSVVSGKAKARVIHIGSENFATKISSGAKYFKKPNSEIWRSLMLIVKIMAAVVIPLGIALIAVKKVVQGGEWDKTVVNTIGSLVGMIPNGLVALSSTVFCISVIRLSKHKTLAQDMYCVETLARVDVLCLDKTGTITSGEMDVQEIEPQRGMDEQALKSVLQSILETTKDENATAVALRNFVGESPALGEAEAVVPFSSVRKWSGVTVNNTSYVLGAPEIILIGKSKDIKRCNQKASEGYRVLAVISFTGKLSEDTVLPPKAKTEGLIYLTDRIRPEARPTLCYFARQGVQCKIISGDNPITVRAVAVRAGLKNCDNIIDMTTLEAGADMQAIAEKYTIFGRVRPEQKLALVKALKANKHTVAMTGDGVNDVLALKEADCSISVASGSDAAKNVSSLVLLDDNFASLPKVVAEGRRSINNLERSASLFLMKTLYNFFIALAFLILPQSLPFEPSQLTLIGMVTIGIPSFVLALERNGERVTGRFLSKVLCNALPGAIMVIASILLVLVANIYFIDGVSEEQMQLMYVLVTTFVGFIYLFRVCLPLHPLRLLLFALLLLLFIGCLFIQVTLPSMGWVGYNPFNIHLDFTENIEKSLLIIALIVLPWFIIMLRLTGALRVKIDAFLDKRDEKKRRA